MADHYSRVRDPDESDGICGGRCPRLWKKAAKDPPVTEVIEGVQRLARATHAKCEGLWQRIKRQRREGRARLEEGDRDGARQALRVARGLAETRSRHLASHTNLLLLIERLKEASSHAEVAAAMGASTEQLSRITAHLDPDALEELVSVAAERLQGVEEAGIALGMPIEAEMDDDELWRELEDVSDPNIDRLERIRVPSTSHRVEPRMPLNPVADM